MLAHLGDAMTVALYLSDDVHIQDSWMHFIHHVDEQSDLCGTPFPIMGAQLLENYSAWTNWDDDTDPVWFEHEDGVIQFMLSWS